MDETNNFCDLYFREIQTSDFQPIKNIHTLLFPVSYGDKFYKSICSGKGTDGLPIISIIATLRTTGEIVGFILAQIENTIESGLFSTRSAHDSACYILTLGTLPLFRRRGLATYLVNECRNHCISIKTCGAIYLHVIDYNTAAIQFYNKNGFHWHQTIYDYYEIQGVTYTAFLYIQHLNGYDVSYSATAVRNASDYVYGIFHGATNWLFDVASAVLPAYFAQSSTLQSQQNTNDHINTCSVLGLENKI